MKTTTKKPRLFPRLLALAGQLPFRLRQGALHLAAALLLSAVSIGGRPLPLGAWLVLILDPVPDGWAAALGAMLGSFLFWPWTQALEPATVTVLCLAAVGLFHDAGLRESPRFAGSLSAALTGAVGLVFLLDMGLSVQSIALFLAKLCLAAFAPALLGRAAALLSEEDAERVLPTKPRRLPDPAEPLRSLSQAFSMLYKTLLDSAPAQEPPRVAQVYDAAAETVCRLCVRSRICWEQRSEQTYQDLCQAAEPIWQRGLALREDFPPRFSGACCHMEGLLTAINQELDQSRCRSQLRSRLTESRRVMASQYLFLSRFLERLTEPAEPAPKAAYRPEFAVCGRSKAGVSGDRGASFEDRWGRFHVLLCDGMGSGSAAARQSGRAVRALAGLLEAGVAPDSALSMLNGCYVLQEGSAFATVDLLQLDLATGEGVLYKWGAAPSYLKYGQNVQTLGAAAPPPGLGVGPEFQPMQLPLSLKGGQSLIMLSDGAFGDAARKRAAAFRGGGAKELAGYLVSGFPTEVEDDVTAAVVRLLPRAS